MIVADEKNKSTTQSAMSILDSTNQEPNPVLQQEGITLEAVLNSILQNGNAFEKLLVRRLRPFLKDVNLVVVRDTRTLPTDIQIQFQTEPRGVYSNERNTIYLDPQEGTDNTTLLHESVHAATVSLIDSWIQDRNVPGMPMAKLDDLMVELTAQMDAAAQHYAEEKAQGRISGEVEFLVEELDVLTDAREFMAYGVTQPEMQEFLSGVDAIFVTKKNFMENGLTRFIDSIAKLFGFQGEKAANGFTSLMDLTDRLLLEVEVVKRPRTSSILAARKEAKKITATGRKIAKSNSASNAVQSASEAMLKVRGTQDSIDLFLAVKDALNEKRRRVLSGVYTTDGLTRILEKLGVKNASKVNNTVEDMGVFRSNKLKTW